MSPVELWHWVHSSYGDELGLTDSDCDYIPPSLEEKSQYQQLTEQLVDKDGLTLENGGIDLGKVRDNGGIWMVGPVLTG